jgi:hypothetical protein
LDVVVVCEIELKRDDGAAIDDEVENARSSLRLGSMNCSLSIIEEASRACILDACKYAMVLMTVDVYYCRGFTVAVAATLIFALDWSSTPP